MKTNNFIVVGQHHGCFLTLRSMLDLGVEKDRIVVVVPKNQVVKYASFPDDVSQNYVKYIKKFLGKSTNVLVAEHWTYQDQLTHVIADLGFDHGLRGPTMVLGAGVIYKRESVHRKLGLLNNYPFSSGQDMYSMIGAPRSLLCKDMFCFNADELKSTESNDVDWARRNAGVPAWEFMRPDPLIGEALSVQECLRFWTRSQKKTSMFNFWMQCLKPEQKPEELLAYPFADYASVAKKVKKYIPETTYNRIHFHAKEASQWTRIQALDL